MYGLKAAGYIANKDLKKHEEPYGYYPSQKIPGLWLDKMRPISFTPAVDDFGIKYLNKAEFNHLIDAIKERYPVKVDGPAAST